jgi:hypothetical protein
VVELLVDKLGLDDAAMVDDGDRGDVGRCLRHSDIVGREGARLDVEEVEGAQHDTSQPEGQSAGGAEPGADGFGSEAGPATVDGGHALVDNRFTGAVTVQAGTFLILQFEQL